MTNPLTNLPFVESITDKFKSEGIIILGKFKETTQDEIYKIGEINKNVDKVVKVEFGNNGLLTIIATRTETGTFHVPVTYNTFVWRGYLHVGTTKATDENDAKATSLINIAIESTGNVGNLVS